AKGGEVLVCKGDVANEEQMLQVVQEAEELFGQIHGVIHAAGIADGSLLAFRDKTQSEKVFSAKVRGTIALQTVFKNKQLDICVFYSSISSILAQMGQVAYCAANNFLDKVAKYQFINSSFVTSINWDAWQEVGMAEESVKKLDESLKIDLSNGILPKEGVKIFDRVLNVNLSQVIVSTSNLNGLISNASSQNESKEKSIYDWIGVNGAKLNSSQEKKNFSERPDLKNEYVAPRTKEEKLLAKIWQEILGIKRVGIEDDFFMLGGNSLTMMRLISVYNDKTGKSIKIQDFYANPTIKEIAAFINNTDEQFDFI
ncbi:SDR family NAD(P)-dependent oxidoreductase, partial [Croceitalea marina]